MSMASPTLRSSSSTLPWLSCSSWATERCARPSTAEMFTGTSKTGARSVAVLSSPPPPSGRPPSGNSSSFRSFSDMSLTFPSGVQGFGVQPFGGERRVQGLRHAFGGQRRIEARRAVAEVEGEGVLAHGEVAAHLDGAREAGLLGGLVEPALQPLGEVGGGGDDQPGSGLDLARQRLERGLHRRLREALQRR